MNVSLSVLFMLVELVLMATLVRTLLLSSTPPSFISCVEVYDSRAPDYTFAKVLTKDHVAVQ